MDFKYPYTDYHELNLDWFLSEFKNLVDTWARTQQDWISMQEYIRDYFTNLNVQTEIDNKINAMISDGTFGAIVEPFVTAALPAMVAGQLPDVVAAQIGAVVADQIDAVVAGQLPAIAAQAAADEVSTWLTAHIDPDTGYVIDDTLTVSQAAADAKATGERLAEIQSDVDEIVKMSLDINNYLYAKDTYINNSMVETPSVGVNLYKIPITTGDVVTIDSTEGLSTLFNKSYRFRFLDSNNDYSAASLNSNQPTYNIKQNFADEHIEALFLGSSTYTHIMIAVLNTDVSKIVIRKNGIYPVLNQQNERFIKPMSTYAIRSNFYYNANNLVAVLSSPAYSLWIPVKSGDRIILDVLLSELNNKGKVIYNDGTTYTLAASDTEYTMTCDGVLYVAKRTDEPSNNYICPKDSFKLEYKNIIDAPLENAYNGLNAVAFGTSLTYRGEEGRTGGYLQWLRPLSGMTIDNQGIGSATILAAAGQPQMMPVITGYSDYADKDVVILEGFINDWYYNAGLLGHWNDSGTTTVCGCLRYALNYIWSQNADTTVFLILDHYGRNHGGVDCSTTALNSNNETQFEWWSELSKVAESMGVRVIKEYVVSEINENTPQYLLDNIHCNALGAKQSGYSIWAEMKKTYPNQK